MRKYKEIDDRIKLYKQRMLDIFQKYLTDLEEDPNIKLSPEYESLSKRIILLQ
jgi:hypothetical protein